MSLLIKGMRIPKPGNYEAIISVDEKRNITLYVKASFPLRALYPYDVVEVPAPHGRLIDADRLLRKCQKISTQAWKMKLHADVEITMNQFIDFVKQASTIIEAEE